MGGPNPGRTPFRERLAWGPVDWQTPSYADRPMMARTFVYLLAGGATLLAITLVLPGAPDREEGPMIAAAAIAALAAAALVIGFDRVPVWALQAMPGLGLALVSVAAYFAGGIIVLAYTMYFFWVILAACYLFELRLALFYAGLSAAACVALQNLRGDLPLPEVRGVLGVGTLLAAAGLVLVLRTRVAGLIADLDRVAGTDSLTGLVNRRRFLEQFDLELERAARTGRPLSLVVIDLDRFKRINDTHGHEAGDDVLREFSDLLRRETRAIDVAGRLGGEEFGILLPETPAAGAVTALERLRARLRADSGLSGEPLTLSAGIATRPVQGLAVRDLMRAADAALYRAKQFGRDRVVVSARPPAVPSAVRGDEEAAAPAALTPSA